MRKIFAALVAVSLCPGCTSPYAEQRQKIESLYAAGKITPAQYVQTTTQLSVAETQMRHERRRRVAMALAAGANQMSANLAQQQAANQAYAANQATIAAANAQAQAQTNAALINGIGRTARGMNDNLYGRDYQVRRQDGTETTVNVRPLNSPTW